MADLSTGADSVSGEAYGDDSYNRLKNHFRGTAVPANFQPGGIQSRSDTNRLFHCVVAGAEGLEILQGDIVCANNEVVCANNEVVFATYV